MIFTLRRYDQSGEKNCKSLNKRAKPLSAAATVIAVGMPGDVVASPT
jgi:hypothetical protein